LPAASFSAPESGPENEAELADSVGIALIVVLEALTPTERLAFVLHDMFGVSFEEIAPIVGRSPSAARQMASRARRRVRGNSPVSSSGASRELVDAFLRAARGGEVETLMTLLDPDVRLRSSSEPEVSGASDVARFFAGRAQSARPALIDGAMGIAVLNAEGQPWILMLLAIAADGRIAAMEAILGDAVADFEVSVLAEPGL
jgi:RNA polymerase sigma-70 factor (ECF subfamily)